MLAFFYIEQAALMSYVGMGLIGNSLSWKKIISISILQGLVVYLSRSIFYGIYGLPFGTHTLMSFISLVILFYFLGERSFGICFGATTIAFILVMLGEGIITPLLYHWYPLLTVEKISLYIWLHIGLSYAASWLLILTASYLWLLKKPLINIETRNRKV